MKKIGICGVPSDDGAAHRGSRLGPSALRLAGIIEALTLLGYTVQDYGDVTPSPDPHPPSNASHLHNLETVVGFNAALKNTVQTILAAQAVPITLGGDHSYAIGSIAAVAAHCQSQNRPLRVLWFDAHADFNSPETSPSGNIHGMPVRVLTGCGPEALLALIEPHGFLPEQSFYQLGIRSVDTQEQVALTQSKVHVFTPEHIQIRGMQHVMDEIIREARAASAHIHVSFDVDGLDPLYAPGVGTTEPHGLRLQDVAIAFQQLKGSGGIDSLDIFELNPTLDIQNQTARVMVDLMQDIF